MYQVDDKPETIHLYVVREEVARPSVAPIILSLLLLSLLLTPGILDPSMQPVTRVSLRVPAVPLAVKSFTASVTPVPTGVRTYPATTARGVLTVTNGSIIAQVIPAGFTIQGVATDEAVYVPAGSADGYGRATVAAHALMEGQQGNMPPLAFHQVIGSSVYIRNLSAFRGGRDAYAVKYVTEQDRRTALSQARAVLSRELTGLHGPCAEMVRGDITLTWRCQIVGYHLLSYMHVTATQVIGKNLIVAVWFIEQPKQIWVK